MILDFILAAGLMLLGFVVLVLSLWIAGSFYLQEGEHAGALVSHDGDSQLGRMPLHPSGT